MGRIFGLSSVILRLLSADNFSQPVLENHGIITQVSTESDYYGEF